MHSQSWVLVPASNYGLSVCLSLSFSYSSAQSPSFLSHSFASLHYFHCFAPFLWFGPPDFLCLSASLSGECLTPLSGGMKLSEVVPEKNAFSSSTHLCGYGVLTAWPTLVPRCSVNKANKAAFQTHSSLHLSSHTTDRLIYDGYSLIYTIPGVFQHSHMQAPSSNMPNLSLLIWSWTRRSW